MHLVVRAAGAAWKHVAVKTAPRAFLSSEIPINQVARVYRYGSVGGEETALKMDALTKEATGKISTQPGYVKTVRTVCKGEWAYEVQFVFDSYDSFVAYDGSDFREKEVLPVLQKSTDLIGAEPYVGVRVYDEM
jgi:hypothetical protein